MDNYTLNERASKGVHIWLDVDSVLADFLAGCHHLFDRLGFNTEIGDVDSWDFSNLYSPPVSREAFDWVIKDAGQTFWEELPLTECAHERGGVCDTWRLAAELNGIPASLNISTCVRTEAAKLGRVNWLYRKFQQFYIGSWGESDGDMFQSIRFPKTFAGKKDAILEHRPDALNVLIDDSVPALESWAEAGGVAIRIPTTLNCGKTSEECLHSIDTEVLPFIESLRCISTQQL